MKVAINIAKKVTVAPLSTLVFGTADGSSGDQDEVKLCVGKVLSSLLVY